MSVVDMSKDDCRKVRQMPIHILHLERYLLAIPQPDHINPPFEEVPVQWNGVWMPSRQLVIQFFLEGFEIVKLASLSVHCLQVIVLI